MQRMNLPPALHFHYAHTLFSHDQKTPKTDPWINPLLQPTAKCDYYIEIVDEKQPMPEKVSEFTTYLKKDDKKIQYQFLHPKAKKLISGFIIPSDLKTSFPIVLNEHAVQQLLPHLEKIFISKAGETPFKLKALIMAEKNPELILKKSPFTEEWFGAREWKDSSPLQYAVWAGDIIAKDFIKILPKDAATQHELINQLMLIKDGHFQRPHLSAVKPLIEAYRVVSDKESRRKAINNELSQTVSNLLQWVCSSSAWSPGYDQAPCEPNFEKFPEVRSFSLDSSYASESVLNIVQGKDKINGLFKYHYDFNCCATRRIMCGILMSDGGFGILPPLNCGPIFIPGPLGWTVYGIEKFCDEAERSLTKYIKDAQKLVEEQKSEAAKCCKIL